MIDSCPRHLHSCATHNQITSAITCTHTKLITIIDCNFDTRTTKTVRVQKVESEAVSKHTIKT